MLNCIIALTVLEFSRISGSADGTNRAVGMNNSIPQSSLWTMNGPLSLSHLGHFGLVVAYEFSIGKNRIYCAYFGFYPGRKDRDGWLVDSDKVSCTEIRT